MPLLRTLHRSAACTAAIWHITEPEAYFHEQTGLETDIKHPRRRIEFLAGRFLLQYLQPAFPVDSIIKGPNGKPYIPDGNVHFSLSHSFPYVAAMIHRDLSCGIDIQVYHEKISAIAYKFVSCEEQSLLDNAGAEGLHLAWCAKEAAFKWLGKAGVDFKAQLPLRQVHHTERGNFTLALDCIHSGVTHRLQVSAIAVPEFAVAFCAAP